jgi:hypothetical protein
MSATLSPAHRHLEFMSPLSGQRADALVKFVAAHARGTVVDIGCGWAALLIRLLEASDRIGGVGIDSSDEGFEHAMRLARERGVADRLALIAGDAKVHLPASVQGALCIGASQVWGPPVEDALPLDYAAALAALRGRVATGSPVVYGEAVWSRAPTPAAIAPLAGRVDEFVFLPELVELAWSAGFAVAQVHEASQDEWDRFESGYTACYAEWLATHDSQHSQHAEILQKARRQRDAYFRGYRGILGMAYLCLLAM